LSEKKLSVISSEIEHEQENREFPVAVLSDQVLFPGAMISLDIPSGKNVAAFNEAIKYDTMAFVASTVINPTKSGAVEHICSVGVLAKVVYLKKSEKPETFTVRLDCLSRGVMIRLSEKAVPCLKAQVKTMDGHCYLTTDEETAFKKSIMRHLVNYEKHMGRFLPRGFIKICSAAKNLGILCDYIASTVNFPKEFKQKMLEETNVAIRAEEIVKALYSEIEIADIEEKIESKLGKRLEKHQKEYVLREKMAVIADELGDGADVIAEAQRYREAVKKLGLEEAYEKKLLKECDRLGRMASNSPDASVVRSYLETCISLPWNTSTKDKTNISAARKKLDRDHYGLEDVKNRIIEQLCVYSLTGDSKAQILCLAGPPGVGKTSIARSVAETMGRKFVRISLGGVKDEAEIRGHRRTYIGSMPGRIMAAVAQAGTNNPLILLDEIDKMGYDYKGDPSTALLEVLDPEQNSTFTDHYIDIPFDLSNVLFITTANNIGTITPPLLDRMDVITINGYTDDEKCQIAKRHLIKKQALKHGFEPKNLKITDKAVYEIINSYTREAGVRSLEKRIAAVCRKAAVERVENGIEKYTLTPAMLEDVLGPAKYKSENELGQPEVGIANGLAWTSVGGDTLQIEVSVVAGTGKIQLTGSLGDVMKESAMTAISYIRSRCGYFGIESDFYSKTDIHIHVPEGAVPKDGPSAGITMATAIVSALTGIPVRSDVAMTGEISLRGRVLPIGGLREKTMAAYKKGIKTVIIPKQNKPDLAKTAQIVRDNIEFVIADNMDTVLETALTCGFDNKLDEQNRIGIVAAGTGVSGQTAVV